MFQKNGCLDSLSKQSTNLNLIKKRGSDEDPKSDVKTDTGKSDNNSNKEGFTIVWDDEEESDTVVVEEKKRRRKRKN